MNILRMPDALKCIPDTFGFVDDFEWFVTAHRWTSVLTDSGTAVAAGVGGILTLTNSDGTVADNDQAYIHSTVPIFKPVAGKPFYSEALIQFTEAATDDANVAFGIASSVAAELIVDDGAGMRTTGTVIAIYKVDGETVWRFVTRNGSDVTVSISTHTAGGAAYQKLSIEILDVLGAYATVVPRVDGNLLRDATTNLPIKHTLLLTSIAAGAVFVGGKNGGGEVEVTNIDYIAAFQGR